MHREHTAFHEAGHAIVALELDVAIDKISINPEDERHAGAVGVEGDDGFSLPLGEDPYSQKNEAAFRRWAEQQAVIDYAGHAALVALLGIGDMGDDSAATHGADDDFDKARLRLGGDSVRMAQAKTRAVEIVTERGDEVRKIAAALLEHTTLHAQQVDNVLYWGTPEGPFGRT